MLDRWPLSTLLLGAFAGWCLLLAVVAIAGLGGKFSEHPDDPGLAPPLPTLGSEAAETEPRPLDAYSEISQRPLFSPDRRPRSVELVETVPDTGAGDLTLTSVIITPELRMALLKAGENGEVLRVREGETLQGRPSWRLRELSPRQAELEGPEGIRTLALRVFDGRGGEVPTRVVAPIVQAEAPAQPQEPTPNLIQPAATNINARERAEEIRRRIEARRQQLREQAQQRRPESQEE